MEAFKQTIYNQILLEPEKVIEEFDLVYTNPKHLTISRTKKKNQFIFKKNQQLIKDENQLQRLKGLVIPPAWQNVKITHLDNGHLQAVGRDVKMRKQYRYHPKWTKLRKQTKFFKLLYFAKHLPTIREAVDKNLNQTKWTQTKVLALVIRLLEETHIKIGNSQYAKRNKTYGLRTLRPKHVNTYKDKITFEFTGKKGKEHKVSIRNRKHINLIHKCEEIPGWELFQYFDENGEKKTIGSSMINACLKSITGSIFTAKDYRTWSGTKIAFLELYDLTRNNLEKLDKHKAILKSYYAAAKALGNTRNVCRTYYVHPAVASAYENDTIQNHFKEIEVFTDDENFTAVEKALINLLKNYNPLS